MPSRPEDAAAAAGSGAQPTPANLPGAASRQDRSHLERELMRHALRILPTLRRLGFARRELRRRFDRRPHRIEFFHQVDDPYSHLALMAIGRLSERYAVDFRYFLVSPTDRLHAPEPELLADWARRDCAAVAPHYGLAFPPQPVRPSPEDVRRVERVLAGRMGQSQFRELAVELGRALIGDEPAARARLVELERARGIGSPEIPPERAAWALETAEEEAKRMLLQGNRRRERKGHYSGGMFWYEGEWYWGVDRLHHLERRLGALGAARSPRPRGEVREADLCFPRPPIDPGPVRDEAGRLTLEIFPSLRSPYTAMIFEKSLALARQAGVRAVLRPVMPMVMRGVPAPAAKGRYIFLDARREADFLGVRFGNMYDPIGQAVVRGFSLWPFARAQGREAEYIAAFLRQAFVLGRPTGTDAGLRRVVESAGLSWEAARLELDTEEFRAELEANRTILYDELGLWGVPSYRLSGPAGEPDLAVWGQDRLWLVAAEIRRRLAA